MSLQTPIERPKVDESQNHAVQKSLDELAEKLTVLVAADQKHEEIMADLNVFEKFMVRRLGAKLPEA